MIVGDEGHQVSFVTRYGLMMTIVSCITVQHDLSLVLLAGLLCVFGSWVTSRLFIHTRNRTLGRVTPWLLLTAATAGVSIWGTHFVAMLGYRPDAPVSFGVPLTLGSLVIAVLGSAFGIMFAARGKMRSASLIGGAILGLTIAAMHYAGMIAYRVQGVVFWDEGYLIASILLSVVFSAVALYFGSKAKRLGELKMTLALTLGIVTLHFTGMTAFTVEPLDILGDYVNPEAFKTLAVAVAAAAVLIVFGGFLSYAVENRIRLENIAELTEARNKAQSASRAKSEFISVLSHELRTPLSIVLGYASILSKLKEIHAKSESQTDDPANIPPNPMGDQAELFGQKISFAANHLLTLINEILDYTNMELDDAKLTRSSFPLQDLLQEIEDQFAAPAEEKSISLHLACDDIIAFADRGRYAQILTNLVGNALKFSNSKDIYLRAHFAGEGFAFEVEDNGRGIPEADHERIFQAFQQLETADKRLEGGTGLGLAICKRLAIAHGGDVSVASILGSGTTFTVSMPASALDQAAPGRALHARQTGLRMAG
ncbi:MAG: signal transduction histidine kinase [Sulfitobacter sp.]|jgi:signal transduction histidine kinase